MLKTKILWRGIKINKFKFHKKIIKDKNGVIGLPLRLTVCIVIGTIALLFILSYIYNPCLFSEKMIVSIDPMINTISSGKNEESFIINVQVKDRKGYPIKNANVIIKGLGDASNDLTENNGETRITISPFLNPAINEGYLDIIVKAACKDTFSQEKMIKIVRGS